MRKKYQKQIQMLSTTQKEERINMVFQYQNSWEINFSELDPMVAMLLSMQIEERVKDDEKYLEVCERNKENWMKWGRPKKEFWTNQKPKKPNRLLQNPKNPSKPKKADNDIWYMIYDSEYDNDNDNKNLNISSNEEIEQSSYWNEDINKLIDLLKSECDNLGIAYDKQKERNFAKFILTAKEFGDFAEKIGQDRVQFATNVLKASYQIKFRKWICAWPMKIYQNYAEVYNETLKQHSKQAKNLIQSF